MDDKLYRLAELIKLMAIDVSKENAHWETESISAALGLFESDLYFDEIKVVDSISYRNITIGDTRGDISRVNGRDIKAEEHKGCMLLYNESVGRGETFRYDCFPSVEEIYKRLQVVVNKGILDDGLSWYEKKDEEALDYYAKVILEHAEVMERIGKTPQELFDSCQ